MPAHAWLGPLADLDLHGVASPHVVSRDTPAARGPLDDQVPARLPLFLGFLFVNVAVAVVGFLLDHTALARVPSDAHFGRSDGQGQLGLPGQRPEGHGREDDGVLKANRLLTGVLPDHHLHLALFAVLVLGRLSSELRRHHHDLVEMGQWPHGAKAAQEVSPR